MAFAFPVAQRSLARQTAWLAGSVALHGALIVAAVRAVPRSPTPSRGRALTAEKLSYVAPGVRLVMDRPRPVSPASTRPPSPAAAAALRKSGHDVRRPGPSAELDVGALRAAVAAMDPVAAPLPPVATLDLARLATSGADFSGAERFLATVVGRAYASATPGATYAESAVDRVVAPLARNPTPRYPMILAQQGVEATLVVEFVVDTTGRVDARSLSFPRTAHRLLVAAVRDALLHSRYFPAELGGQRVRQLVQQQFAFVLRR